MVKPVLEARWLQPALATRLRAFSSSSTATIILLLQTLPLVVATLAAAAAVVVVVAAAAAAVPRAVVQQSPEIFKREKLDATQTRGDIRAIRQRVSQHPSKRVDRVRGGTGRGSTDRLIVRGDEFGFLRLGRASRETRGVVRAVLTAVQTRPIHRVVRAVGRRAPRGVVGGGDDDVEAF